MDFFVNAVDFEQSGTGIVCTVSGNLPSPAFKITGRSARLEGPNGPLSIDVAVAEAPGIWAQKLVRAKEQITLPNPVPGSRLEYAVHVNGQLAKAGVATIPA
jgi:hypothetical protein